MRQLLPKTTSLNLGKAFPITESDLQSIVCMTCGKLGHLSCGESVESKESVDWAITEAIDEGIYAFVSNYDSWQEFRKKMTGKTKPCALPPVIAPSVPSVIQQKEKPVPSNDFMSLMTLDMD